MRRWWIVLAVGLSGCREPAPVVSGAKVVDSAGIQVITSSAPGWGDTPRWKVASDPSLVLGGVAGDPALDFLSIVGAKRLDDGSLVVANGGTGELRWFSPEGTPVRSVGGRASAKSPFAAIASFYSLGDTLVAWDARARVLTRLSSEGMVLRQDTLRIWASRYARLVLERAKGNKREACRVLDISYHTLQAYLRFPWQEEIIDAPPVTEPQAV